MDYADFYHQGVNPKGRRLKFELPEKMNGFRTLPIASVVGICGNHGDGGWGWERRKNGNGRYVRRRLGE